MSLPARNHRSVTRAVYRARAYLPLPRDLPRRGPTPRGSDSPEAPSTLTPLRGERLRLLGLLLDEHGAQARQIRRAPRVGLRVDEGEDARPRRVRLGGGLERLEEGVLAFTVLRHGHVAQLRLALGLERADLRVDIRDAFRAMPVPREPDSPVGFHTGADVVRRRLDALLDERVLGGLALGDLGSIYVTGLVGHVLVAEVHVG